MNCHGRNIWIGLVLLSVPGMGCGDVELSMERPLKEALMGVSVPVGEVEETAGGAVPENVPDKCEVRSAGRMEIADPTRMTSYELSMLGVVRIAATAADMMACIERAIDDGAELLRREEGEVLVFYPTRFELYLDAARERIDIDAVEGRWSEGLHRVLPGVTGRKLNLKRTEEAFRRAVLEGTARMALEIEEYPALSSDLSSFSDFRPTELIGEYRTVFSNAKNRTINVKLAASKMDGLFLMPGAEFSYNAWVGERSLERGFKEAPVIEQGQTVEGLGGGACQVSSTIHAAALLAGLGIEERYNHSLPSSYIPVGMDAVVSYPMLDLRVKNTLSRPVVLRVKAVETTLIAQFFSDERPEHEVMFRREVVEEVPYKEVITVNPTLESGTIKIRKKGKVGYRVQRGRIFIENGKERFEKLLQDTYQSQTQQTEIAWDVVYPPPEEEED